MTTPPAPADRHAALQRDFRWQVPARFNMAQACCNRWAARGDASKRIAVAAYSTGAGGRNHSYAELKEQADLLSAALARLGVARGDRVAIVMPQRFETAVAYMGVLQMGTVAMPLSQLFGPEALEFRLRDAGATVAICDARSLPELAAARAACPALAHVVGVGGAAGDGADHDWHALLTAGRPGFGAVDTAAGDPAVLIYTSGTTGQPKGALLPHRALIGNLPGFVCSQNWFGYDPAAMPLRALASGAADAAEGLATGTQAVFWSPADWAWTGGLMDALLPTLYFGRPIVACGERFAAELAFRILDECRVTHSFLFPTALKSMMKTVPHPRQRHALKLQALMSGGEAVGDAVFAYCHQEMGVVVNEMFGQTETNYIVGNCGMNVAPTLPAAQGSLPPEGAPAALGRPGGGEDVAPTLPAAQGLLPLPAAADPPAPEGAGGRQVGWPVRPGSMGRGYPGHVVGVIDEEGREAAAGVAGEIAVRRTDVHGDADPIFLLGYWGNEAATRAKFTGDWWRTGDMAVRDADGYLWYQGRADDVFKSSGYRIGPGEIENCLLKHPAVAGCAVVPKPDAERGAVVKAYVVLTPEFIAAAAGGTGPGGQFGHQLVQELQAHVKGQLAPYEYPKEIEFIDALPMTSTGKVQRRVLRLQEAERAAGR